MDIIPEGVPQPICYISDICIAGANNKEHLHILKEVLICLKHHGIAMKQTNCQFCVKVLCTWVMWLMYEVAWEDHKSNKIDAISYGHKAQNILELCSLLELNNYYGNLFRISQILQPINNLLRSNVKWEWSILCN